MEVKTSALAVAMLCMSASALEVYQVPSGGVTGGIDLLGMSETYYTDRLKGRNNTSISGAVTHSAVTEENPFLLMGGHTSATSFNPSTTLDTIPIRIVDGGYWKYVNDSGSLAQTYKNKPGYGHLEIEKGIFQAYSLGLFSDGSERSVLSVTNGCSLQLSSTLHIGYNNGCGTFVLDGGTFITYSTVEMGDNMASDFASVNTAIVANATLNVGNGDSIFWMARNSTATDGTNTTTDRNVLVLGEGGVLWAAQVVCVNNPRGHVVFRGGEFRGRGRPSELQLIATKGTSTGDVELEGDGFPIHIDVGTNVVNLCGDWTKLYLTGDGGFKKSGSGKLTLNNPNARMKLRFSGGVTVDEGILAVARSNDIPATNFLSVAEGAAFDLNGRKAGFTGAAGLGVVTNSSATAATLTLGYGDGDYAFSTAVGGDVSLVKTGTGTLTVSGNAAGNGCDLDITAGTVAFDAKNSSSYGTVTVRSGATLDISKCNFTCVNLVKEPGGTIKNKPGFSLFVR